MRRLHDRLRHTEVRYERVATRLEQVLWLDVTVHHATLVRVRERVGHVTQEAGLPPVREARRRALGVRGTTRHPRTALCRRAVGRAALQPRLVLSTGTM